MILSLASSICLHQLSDYDKMFKWLKVVHPTLIMDLIQAKFQLLVPML